MTARTVSELHALFIREAGPAPVSPLGDKPSNLASRRRETRRISELMAANDAFSFLRLGDVELTVLLGLQDGIALSEDDKEPIDGTTGYGSLGLTPDQFPRLRRAFENASYVDFHERLWPISVLLPRLALARSPKAERNPNAECSYLLLTWLECEFRTYASERRILLAGAEARLLEELRRDARFRAISEDFWPTNSTVFFHQIRNDGRNIGENFDLIKEDLRRAVQQTKVDTVFLSLGGGKILCVELAEELGVRIFDAGAMLRSLCYSGSDGNRACRSTHFLFLHRVPFDVWCDAMERAWPKLPPHERLAKVHAQLIVEVQRKEVGWTHASWELDLSSENRAAFAQAHSVYYARYAHLFDRTDETRRERSNFLHFCGTHGLTDEGRRFLRQFALKRKMWRWLGFRDR